MRSNFGLYKIFVKLFIFENDSSVFSPRPVDLKSLREVNFSAMDLLPMGRSNHAWFTFLMIVLLKAMAIP
jgi:hypothetical protein